MSVADGMRKMLALGIPVDEALAIVEAFEIPVTDARKERNRRYYEAHKPVLNRLNSDADPENPKRLKASEKRLNSDASTRARVEDKPLLLEIEPLKKVKEDKKVAKVDDASEFRAEFGDLDTVRLDALVKHRKAKRGQITGHAARLLRADIAACGLSVSDGVDTCISRNWITLKPDWLDKNQARGSPGVRPKSGLAALTEEFKQELAEDGYADQGQKGRDTEDDARFPLLTGPDHS